MHENLHREGNFFLYTPIAEQLASLLTLNENEKAIIKFQNVIREAQEYEYICDVINADRYKELVSKTSMATNGSEIPFLSFSINLDGVQASKSSQNSIYPLMLVLNELPYHLRQCNILIPFIFLKCRGSQSKFHTNYLTPFVNDMKQLGEKGFRFYSKTLNRELSFPVFAYSLNCDSVMKCDLLHLKGVTGYFSCPKCKQKGISVPKGKSSTVAKPTTVNPNNAVVMYEARTKADLMDVHKNEDGISGVSVLVNMPEFSDIFANTSIDSMHAVYIGVFKCAAKLWFKVKGKPFSVSPTGYTLAKQAMLKISPSSSIVRGIRSLDERADWKASEWRSFGYFWAPLVLQILVDGGYLPEIYLKNWIHLLQGLSLLNSEMITKLDILAARKKLYKFCVQFTKIYGKEHAILNFHLISHLADSVARVGPLWATSLFINESFNQVVLNCFRNGTRGVVQQVAERFTWRNFCVHINSWLKLKDCRYHCKIAESCWNLQTYVITRVIQPLGKQLDRKLDELTVNSLSAVVYNLSPEIIQLFDRIKIGSMIFNTRRYHDEKRLKKKDTLFYADDMRVFGEIVDIVKVRDDYFVIYEIFEPLRSISCQVNNLKYASFGHFTSMRAVIPAKCLTRRCTLLNFALGPCFVFDTNSKEGS